MLAGFHVVDLDGLNPRRRSSEANFMPLYEAQLFGLLDAPKDGAFTEAEEFRHLLLRHDAVRKLMVARRELMDAVDDGVGVDGDAQPEPSVMKNHCVSRPSLEALRVN